MRRQWIGWMAAAWMGLITSSAFGQSLLEQLEKQVRDSLELNAPAGQAEPAVTEEQLPAPKKTPPPSPPPPPTAAPVARASSSILEPPAPAAQGAPEQPSPGVTGETAEEPAAIYLGLEAESLTGGGIGARVVAVTENSPAWRAGFRVGDVILALDGFAIANLDTMVDRLAPRRPGDAVRALVLRGGRNIELTAILQNAAVAQRIQNGGAAGVELPMDGPAWLGIAVADLSTAFRNQFGLRVYRAAAVTDVTGGSPADAAKIQIGDAIVAVDGRKIESARALTDWLVGKRPGDRVRVSVMRGTRATSVDLTLTSDPRTAPLPPRKPVVSDPLDLSTATAGPADPTGELVLGDYAETAVGRAVVENTVPAPVGAEQAEIEQLREELRAARELIGTLEQRIGDLESRLEQPPQ